MNFRNEFRIVIDAFAGYEVQVRRWWFPIWLECGNNTHHSVEEAEEYAHKYKFECVKYLGRL